MEEQKTDEDRFWPRWPWHHVCGRTALGSPCVGHVGGGLHPHGVYKQKHILGKQNMRMAMIESHENAKW